MPESRRMTACSWSARLSLLRPSPALLRPALGVPSPVRGRLCGGVRVPIRGVSVPLLLRETVGGAGGVGTASPAITPDPGRDSGNMRLLPPLLPVPLPPRSPSRLCCRLCETRNHVSRDDQPVICPHTPACPRPQPSMHPTHSSAFGQWGRGPGQAPCARCGTINWKSDHLWAPSSQRKKRKNSRGDRQRCVAP